MKVCTDINLPGLKIFRKGKVRNVFDLGSELLIVASDRISAFDCVLSPGIPDKGTVLTRLSLFWFDMFRDLLPNHIITADSDMFPEELSAFRDELEGRSILAKKAEPLPVECVVRGYLAGSGLKDYLKTGTVCGHKLPDGLREADKLPEVIFTPSTKADAGHDENIDFDAMINIIGRENALKLRELSVKLYSDASEYADSKGIIIADTKFEFGIYNGETILIDEIFTPDSSRFWPKETYSSGSSPKSYDKQFVRDYLEELGWDKKPPAPLLPEHIITKTREKYLEALYLLTSERL